MSNQELDMAIALRLQAEKYESEIKRLRSRNNSEMQKMKKGADSLSLGFANLNSSINPVDISLGGLVTGAIAGGIAGFIALNNAFSETAKQQRQLASNFGVTGQELQDTTIIVKQLTKRGYDYNQMLESVTAYSKEFGIEGKKAFQEIKEYADKGLLDDEVLEQMKEYSVQAKDAKLTSKQFLEIITTSRKEGFFTDKLIDSVKEGLIKLREMPKATQDAINKLDKHTQQQIKAAVASGDYFKAMQAVSKAIADGKVKADEYGEVVANIFGSPGEDLGKRGISAIKDFNGELDNLGSTISELEKSNNALSDSWVKLTTNTQKSGNAIGQALASVNNHLSGFLDKVDAVAQGNTGFWDTFGKDFLSKAGPVGFISSLFMDDDLTADEVKKKQEEQRNATLDTQLAILTAQAQKMGVISKLSSDQLERAKERKKEIESTVALSGMMSEKQSTELTQLEKLIDGQKKLNKEKAKSTTNTKTPTKRAEIAGNTLTTKKDPLEFYQGVTVGEFGADVPPPEKFFKSFQQRTDEQLAEYAKHTQQVQLELMGVINSSLDGLIQNSISSTAETIGMAIGGAKISLQGVLAGFAGMLADTMKMVGENMIQIGVSKNILESLTSVFGAGFGIIAAGAGLVALSGVVRSQAQELQVPELANGAVVYGDSLVRVGEYNNARTNPEVIAPLNKLKSLLPSQNGVQQFELSTKLKGADIELVLRNHKKLRSSTR